MDNVIEENESATGVHRMATRKEAERRLNRDLHLQSSLASRISTG